MCEGMLDRSLRVALAAVAPVAATALVAVRLVHGDGGAPAPSVLVASVTCTALAAAMLFNMPRTCTPPTVTGESPRHVEQPSPRPSTTAVDTVETGTAAHEGNVDTAAHEGKAETDTAAVPTADANTVAAVEVVVASKSTAPQHWMTHSDVNSAPHTVESRRQSVILEQDYTNFWAANAAEAADANRAAMEVAVARAEAARAQQEAEVPVVLNQAITAVDEAATATTATTATTTTATTGTTVATVKANTCAGDVIPTDLRVALTSGDDASAGVHTVTRIDAQTAHSTVPMHAGRGTLKCVEVDLSYTE